MMTSSIIAYQSLALHCQLCIPSFVSTNVKLFKTFVIHRTVTCHSPDLQTEPYLTLINSDSAKQNYRCWMDQPNTEADPILGFILGILGS